MRVLLADARVQVRSALHILLDQEAGLVLVGDVDDGRSLLTIIDATRPDLLLLDWELPYLVGPRLLEALRMRFPDLQIMVLSCQLENRNLALDSGAIAFVSKIDPPDRLLELLRCMASKLAFQPETGPTGAVRS